MSTADNDWDWALTQFVNHTPSVAHAIVTSADGVLVARSARLPPDQAGQLAAVVAGLVSLLVGGAERCFDSGDVRQCVVEMTAGCLLITVIPGSRSRDSSSFGVLVAADAELSLVGYEMEKQAERFRRQLTPAPRDAGSRSGATT